MGEYVIPIAAWFVPSLAVAGYLWARRAVRRSLSLLVFDSAALGFVGLLCVAFWWREITGHVSRDVWLDEQGFLALLVPVWTSIISVPLLLVAAAVRIFVFGRAP